MTSHVPPITPNTLHGTHLSGHVSSHLSLLARLRVTALQASVRHEPTILPPDLQTEPGLDERTDGGAEDFGEPPDLFRLLPAASRRAFDLGLLTADPAFHVFVEADVDVDIIESILGRATERLRGRTVPIDVVYVHDFDTPSAPRPLLFPPGVAPRFAAAVAELLETIRNQLPSLDASERVRETRTQFAKQLKEKQQSIVGELETLAKGLSFGVRTVPGGVQTFPILHGKPVSPEQFDVLDELTKTNLTNAEEKLASAIAAAAERVRSSSRDIEDAGRALEETQVRALVETHAGPLLGPFFELPDIRPWAERLLTEIVASVEDFRRDFGPKGRANPNTELGLIREREDADPEIATRMRRFDVNVFVTHDVDPTGETGIEPPVVFEDNPTLAHLFGYLERRVSLGALITDFTRIRAGSLHRASGGVLVVRALDVVTDPLAWNRLKRVMRACAVGHDDPIGPLGLYATTLKPRACPIATKIIMVGPHEVYATLLEADPDFGALFRVKVEIPSVVSRTPENILALDTHILRVARTRGYGRPDRPARARLLDYACRLAEHGRKLSLALQPIEETLAFASVGAIERQLEEGNGLASTIADTVDDSPHPEAMPVGTNVESATESADAEADNAPRARNRARKRRYVGKDAAKHAISSAPVSDPPEGEEQDPGPLSTRTNTKSQPPPSLPPPPFSNRSHSLPPTPTLPMISVQDIDAAWLERRDRSAGAERDLREMVLDGEVLLATEGERTGVVNGLSVLSAGDVQFGHPMRITAVVSLGSEGLIDVEREASLGGALHTKGVAILRGFLSGTFGQERPVGMRAQIAFEQSYGEVEGDSASSSELFAILSALSEVPIRQHLAVTGSVNQLGEIQAIGGVAAKIEGFFDLCAARGLRGNQGVVIPKSCVAHLVLRDDVVAAIRDEQFHLYAVQDVAEGIEVLTGIRAGHRDDRGRFPAESVFGRVERRLIEIAERMRRAGGAPDMGGGGNGDMMEPDDPS